MKKIQGIQRENLNQKEEIRTVVGAHIARLKSKNHPDRKQVLGDSQRNRERN